MRKPITFIFIFSFISVCIFGQVKTANINGRNSKVFLWDNMEVVDVPYMHKMSDNIINTYFSSYKDNFTIYCIGMAEGNKLTSACTSNKVAYNAYSFFYDLVGKNCFAIAINMDTTYFDKVVLERLIVHEIAHCVCAAENKVDLNHDTPLWTSLRKDILKKSNNSIDIDASIYGHH